MAGVRLEIEIHEMHQNKTMQCTKMTKSTSWLFTWLFTYLLYKLRQGLRWTERYDTIRYDTTEELNVE